jgi:hypothetical protein
MNSRLQEFENLITRPDGSVDDLFSQRQRESNDLEQIMSMNPQQAYQLSTSIQAQFDSLKDLIGPMRKNFIEASAEALKEKPEPTRQRPYQNILPYGTEEGDSNPNRTQEKPIINAGLENLDPSLTNQLHQLYIRIFRIMFSDSYKELKDEIFENYGNKSVRANDIDEVCLNKILSSAVGSMFDWPSIDPKSVGLGSIEHIADLFQKYYFGEVDEKNPHQEKTTSGRKYTGGANVLEIQGDKFYDDFINGSFFRHCVEGIVSKTKTAPDNFEKVIDNFYNFNPELWFGNDASGNFKHCDPTSRKDCDSYGNFFKVKQPIKIVDAIRVAVSDPRDKASYDAVAANAWTNAVRDAQAKRNVYTGMYDTYNANADETFILSNVDKPMCCLFHKATIRDREFVNVTAIANRIFSNATLTDFDFTNANRASYGNGTDRGPDANTILAGANDSINTVAQLLYNSKSIGFHLTQNAPIGPTLLVAGGTSHVQMITGYSCGKLTGQSYLNTAGAYTAYIASLLAIGIVEVARCGPIIAADPIVAAAAAAAAAFNALVVAVVAGAGAAAALAAVATQPAGTTAILGIAGISQATRAAANDINTANANYVAALAAGGGLAGACSISDGAGGAPVAPTETNLIQAAGDAPTPAEITTTLNKQSFQAIPITTLMKGGKYMKLMTGSGKSSKIKATPQPIKKISKQKTSSSSKKDKKSNPVKKVSKRIKKQRGGAEDNFFDIRSGAQNGTPTALDASRRPETLTKKIVENYRKSLTEYIRRFGSGSDPDKVEHDIFDKLRAITHLGVFYHGPDGELNFGGANPNENPIKFEELGEMFLFCSVITNTIKLLIHFFKNIKACISHFVKSELDAILSGIDNKLKVVNSTNISSYNATYFSKYVNGCEELNKQLDKLINFLRNNTMCLGEPINSGDAAAGLTKDEQIVVNLFFGANIHHQNGSKVGIAANFAEAYPLEFYTFHHDLINFFSSSERTFKKINTMKFERALRVLSSGDIVLNNGFVPQSPAPHLAYPKKEYSKTNVSLGGIPLTFIKSKATQYSWMTYGLLLNHREKSNEQLEKDKLLEINNTLSQISTKDKAEIKQKVIDAYKNTRPILADPKIDLGSKNKVLRQIFMAFFEDSNKVAKMIIQDHDEMEKKSKSVNVRKKTSIVNIVRKRSITAAEGSRVLEPKEIEIQQEMRKYSYKVDCLVNLLHTMLISTSHGSMKNYIIFMYAISRLRNFVYRLYYLNKSFYIEKEDIKKKLLTASGFDLSRNKNKNQNKKETEELFKKMINVQLVDQNSHTQEWWKVMETTFRNRTSVIHGKYFRLFAFVLMDNETFLVDIFSMANSEHSIKSYSEILKKDILTYKDHHGHDIYHPDNMLIKLPDFSKNTFYKKLLKGELYYEYLKDGTKNKKKLLEPLFIQGSTKEQLDHIVYENRTIPAAGGRPSRFIRSTKPETSFQIYRIEKHHVLHASAFRSWAYNLLFSMPTRIDVDDSYFKLHIQKSINNISPLGTSQLIPSLEEISKINSITPVVNFKSKVKVNNTSKLMLNNNINNKRIESQAKYISREQIIMLGLVFGDTLN